VDEFQPDIIHAHHPFFLGNSALRAARSREVPLVFTHHTMWDHYTHYTAVETPATARFVEAWVAGYSNLCDVVIAPSRSVAELLRERGVTSRIEIIPTGVDVARFSHGNGERFRQRHEIPADAFLIGYVGRLAPEKNLAFLAESVGRFLAVEPKAHWLVVGSGPSEAEIRRVMAAGGCVDRVHLAGVCDGQHLIDAFHALDVFSFASQTETQGMVLTEAMAAGKPVVALDGPGVRDVVRDRANGRLVSVEHQQLFAQGLAWVALRTRRERAMLAMNARRTAERFSMSRQATRALKLYRTLVESNPSDREETVWRRARRRIEAEWTLLENLAHAASHALESPLTESTPRR
jgi:glycosyltransferase involved in cell wall biosynthesis